MAECAGSFSSWIMWKTSAGSKEKADISAVVVLGYRGNRGGGDCWRGRSRRGHRFIRHAQGQASLVAIVAAAQKFRENRQRHAARRYQGQAGSGLVPVRRVDGSDRLDWAGQEIGANSDGKGVLAIAISKRITVKTWNNDFSDLMHHTLMQPGSPLFNTASGLKVGQKVKFSGTFFKGRQRRLPVRVQPAPAKQGRRSRVHFPVQLDHAHVRSAHADAWRQEPASAGFSLWREGVWRPDSGAARAFQASPSVSHASREA